MIFLLGALSGAELVLFSSVGLTTVNDGIMTGNTKNLVTNFYQWIFDHDKSARKKFLDLFYTILIFILGVGFGSLVVSFNPAIVFWIGLFLSIILFLLVTYTGNKIEQGSLEE